MSQTTAQSKIEDAGLTFTIDDTAYSETVPAGDVISTDPAPATTSSKNGTVSVVVSQGPERHDVPNLDGHVGGRRASPRSSRPASRSAPSTATTTTTCPRATSCRSVPTAGTALKRNAPGRPRRQQGPEAGRRHRLLRPAREGRRAPARRRRARRSHRHYHYDDNVATGLVIRPTPSNGTLFAGDPITSTSAKGPHLVEVPDVYFFGVDAAVSALDDAGFKVDQRARRRQLRPRLRRRTEPRRRTMAPFGSTVTIYII